MLTSRLVLPRQLPYHVFLSAPPVYWAILWGLHVTTGEADISCRAYVW